MTLSGGAEPALLVLAGRPEDVARMRRYAVERCRARGDRGDCDVLALLVSEVATNALLHGSGDVSIRVVDGSGSVRVEVGDDSPRRPLPRDAEPSAESGRGIALVEALSSRWGVTARDPGKTVWFELPCA